MKVCSAGMEGWQAWARTEGARWRGRWGFAFIAMDVAYDRDMNAYVRAPIHYLELSASQHCCDCGAIEGSVLT